MRVYSLLLLIAFVPSACAQTRDTAAIFGTVTDAQGAAIPGAPVTDTNANTGQAQKVTTDARRLL